MNSSKSRYKLAVYLFVATLSVIFILIGVNYFRTDNPIKDILLNLSTELAGVVIIFLIIDILFLIDRDRDMIYMISQVRDELRTRGNPFRSRESARNEFNLKDRLLKAQTLDLLGYSFANLLGTFREEIAEAISRGTRVRLMILDPFSIAGDLMRQNISNPDGVTEGHERSLRYISEIKTFLKNKGKIRGSLEVKLVSWVPSCYINMIDAKKDHGIALIGINSLVIKTGSVRHLNFILHKNSATEEFDFFVSQYDLLWQTQSNRNITDHAIG